MPIMSTDQNSPKDIQVPNFFDDVETPLHPFKTRFTSEVHLMNVACEILGKLCGIHRLAKVHSSRNDNFHCHLCGPFPSTRFHLLCSHCSASTRTDPVTEEGVPTCGLIIKVAVTRPRDKLLHHYLSIKHLYLPTTSWHANLKSPPKPFSSPIRHQKRVDEHVVLIIKQLGVNRVAPDAVLALAKTIYPQGKLDKELVRRIMREGRNEAFGATVDESMVVFTEKGLDGRNRGGRFNFWCAPDGKLLSWVAQEPLEKQIAELYGLMLYFIDTSHNCTMFTLKTCPLVTVDCFGFSANMGIFQVPEEDCASIDRVLTDLEMNQAGTQVGTDNGSAWPEPLEKRKQVQVKDVFHMYRNYKDHASKSSNPKRFKKLCYEVLHVWMTEKQLLAKLQEMRDIAEGTEAELSAELVHEHVVLIIKQLGVNRVAPDAVLALAKTIYPQGKLDKELVRRIMREGRNEAFGATVDESMVVFTEKGLDGRNRGGRFNFWCAPDGKLLSWVAQEPLEKQIAELYGLMLYFIDTSHNCTMFTLKTCPLVTVDCFGFSANMGIFQVPEEDCASIDRVLTDLEMNQAGTQVGTDNGSAWPEPLEKRKQVQVKDVFHMYRNYKDHASKSSNPKRFKKLCYEVLHVWMTEKQLLAKLQEMRDIAEGTEAELSAELMYEDRDKPLTPATQAP